MMPRISSLLPAAILLITIPACASYPPPTDAVAGALASMRGAEELGAAQVPQASLQLQLAAEEVNRAKRLMADKKHQRAHYMAVRAANDAELAIALTREAQAQKAAQQASQGAQATTLPTTTPASPTPEVNQ